ncbi:MAG: hypothetical protein JEZ04_13325 [Spirochaetales bacterium]|nr:hypothetical protein [Spirochaetales bacterium]
MKEIVLFSDSPAVRKHFIGIENSRNWDLQMLPHAELRNRLKNNKADLYLLDYASVDEENKKKDLDFLLRKTGVISGIIDRKSEIADPAGILMRGADYFGNSLLKKGIKPERLNRSVEFLMKSVEKNISSSSAAPAEQTENTNTRYIIPENGWRGVKSGMDYSFLMLFTEISFPAEWKKKSGQAHLDKLKYIFHMVVEREIEKYDGKVWIWNEYGGLILFPFNGESAAAVISAVKLLLNRVLISIEDFQLHSSINMRAAMHLGTTTYKTRGKTGTIISDSINSIFHLGTQFTPLDNLDITEEVYHHLTPRIKNLFRKTGFFEDRNIFRLNHFEVNG